MTYDTFSVQWDTGDIEVIVGSYFTTASVAQIRKLFKLSRNNCKEEQRKKLLNALQHACVERKELLDSLTELARKKADMLNEFYGVSSYRPEVGSAEKAIERERTRLRKAIEILKEEGEWLW